MSVLIRGMKMPINCMLCPFCVEEADPANGEMCVVTGTLMSPCTRERLDNCPIVPVPPHGRLIDADAFTKDECNNCDGACEALPCDCLNCEANCRCDFIKDVADAPTIIEAEEVSE